MANIADGNQFFHQIQCSIISGNDLIDRHIMPARSNSGRHTENIDLRVHSQDVIAPNKESFRRRSFIFGLCPPGIPFPIYRLNAISLVPYEKRLPFRRISSFHSHERLLHDNKLVQKFLLTRTLGNAIMTQSTLGNHEQGDKYDEKGRCFVKGSTRRYAWH